MCMTVLTILVAIVVLNMHGYRLEEPIDRFVGLGCKFAVDFDTVARLVGMLERQLFVVGCMNCSLGWTELVDKRLD